jgi:VanZ family protein
VSDGRSFALWAPVAAYMAFLFGLSSIAETPPVPGGVDKHVHAWLYAGLAVVTLRALVAGWRVPVTVWHVGLTIAITTAYGISDEFHQSFVPPRTSDWRDVLADAIGATVAACACLVWSALRTRRRRGV